MISQPVEDIGAILKLADDAASDLQPWPNYFKSKTDELHTVFKFCDIRDYGNILEIGCGNGFTASLLSSRAEQVTAFDLPFENLATHSVGIKTAGELIGRLGIRNVRIIGGSAEELPFPDKSFDLIFSAYALNYVKGRDRALKEMHRVLSDKGAVITLVPNFMERVFAPFIKCEYLAKQVLLYMSGRRKRTGTLKPGSGLGGRIFVKPDGPYRSSMQELWKHRPSVWARLFEANGFRVVNIFSVQLLPVGLFDLLGRSGTRLVSKALFNLNRLLGNSPAAKKICYSLGIMAVKN